MAFDYAKTASTLLEKVGGEKNVNSVTHCMTRLRFLLKDGNVPADTEVERVPGVIRVIRQGGQYQVVIGNEVSSVFQELTKLGNFSDSAGGAPGNSEEGIFSRLCGFIAGCMTPLLPAMLGCGMMKVVLTLLTTFNLIDASGSTFTILTAVGDAFFYFMPIFLANTTAKKLGSNPYIAMVIAGVMLHPELIGLLAQGNTTYFGLPVTSASYSSSVIPVLLMVPIMKYVEKYTDKICPSMVKSFLKPLIIIFISVPIALVVIGPLGTIVGNFMAAGVNVLYTKAGWLAIMVLSALMPFIVMTGMHYALVPICTIGLATSGYDAILIITMFCSNLAQGAASLAVAVKSKDIDVKSTATAAGISAMVAGVTEPALYGVTLKYKTPLIAAVIGAGAAGLYCGITHAVAFSMGGSPSLFTPIQMIGGEGFGNMVNGLIGMAITLGVTFAATLILYKPETSGEGEKGKALADQEAASAPHASASLIEKISIKAPSDGKIVLLESVPDPVFADGVLGQGLAILPESGEIYAPADGIISALVDSRHAVGITTDHKVELLIHVGLDTVKMNGEGFAVHCKVGDHVKEGQLLLTFDKDKIQAAGFTDITPVIISNMGDFVSMKITDERTVKHGDMIFTIV